MQSSLTNRQKTTFAALFFLMPTFFLLVVIEAGVRLRQWIKYGTTNASVVSYQTHGPSGLRIPIPNSETGSIRINSLGFRGPEIDDPKPRGRIRLAFLGGSTTFCAEVTSNEVTWPHLVWKKVTGAYPRFEFDYVNAGVPGYGTGELLTALEQRVKPLRPDIVVIYEATNDISYDTRELAKEQGFYRGKAEVSSWLANISVAWNLIEKNLQIRARQRAAGASEPHLVFDRSQLSRDFKRRLIKLIQASKKVSPVVVVATFSTKFRREQSKQEQLQAANTALYYMPYMSVNGLLDAFEQYNTVIRDVAQETGALLIGGEDAIPGDDLHFNDSVHFKDKGSKAMAHRVATGLINSGRLEPLIKSMMKDESLN